jgi:hypothetical protein
MKHRKKIKDKKTKKKKSKQILDGYYIANGKITVLKRDRRILSQ